MRVHPAGLFNDHLNLFFLPLNKKKPFSRKTRIWITMVLVLLFGVGIVVYMRFGPSHKQFYAEVQQTDLFAKTIDSTKRACDLTVRRYKQIGAETQFELASSAAGLAPYDVEVVQEGNKMQFKNVPHRPGTWLTLENLELKDGVAVIHIKSLGQKDCETTASFVFDGKKRNEILGNDLWVRQGSKDNMLDVRPVLENGKIYLKDFADYQDGRTMVRMIDGVEVKNLKDGIEVKPGYLYSITARWIDGPYNDWWNKLRNRTVRQQNIWLNGKSKDAEQTVLTKIETPSWFSFNKDINVYYDTEFPEFQPIAGKMVMQFRSNEWVSPQNYFKRGVNYLNGSEKDIPSQKLHWTATPNMFDDKNAEWFASLSREQVESYADKVPDLGVYAMDYEFWNQVYTPEVKQRLIWFSERLHKNHPNFLLFDYWGGAPYHNLHISKAGKVKPLDLVKDYAEPKANQPNFDPLPNGQSFQNLFGITPVDVYSKAMFPLDAEGNSTNNFVLLSAIHSLRINQRIPYQKKNKFIFYAWNRYQPLYGDPIVPWHYQTTAPKGELVLNQMEMMPASQALSFSLFSLFLFDGYYLWSDGQPAGKDPNGFNPTDETTGSGREWYPADGKTPVSAFRKSSSGNDTPRYWDFPTQYYVLGNWMVKQVEDILDGGKNQDLAYEVNGAWKQPKPEQALLAADRKEPFVTSVVNGEKIAVLAVDSFQQPTASRKLNIKLPDGTQTTISLYGNWPVLYRGILKN
jgi:hypothetical protein